ncbi:hypothetical protein [Bordetella bronchiseptica]|uniref:hypothetical protein n=1 Tax=Bordetella bronchiseptica TaxID=518 RepID=UPI00028F949E|nr:hypothetical protein [Bordetella bronchiseptica]AWP80966.1 hypothetical protein B7P04_17295 [Bordetella bronchiseptica]KAK74733.1 hypothetical protein L530_3456 [Bordetella bronchiseptica MO211]CCN17229.1 putative uncharacterized protein [Bordetella bronchiseptica MO211]
MTPTIPAGWQLVPERATQSMEDAWDAPPRFTISASDHFELTGAVGLLRGYGCEGAADALQRTLDAEMAGFSVQGEEATGDARDAHFDLWQDDMVVATASGPRSQALNEIQHYAAMYSPDGPVQIEEVIRIPLSAAIAAQQGEGGEA